MTNAGCGNIAPTSALTLDEIPVVDNSNTRGYQICVKREAGVDFVEGSNNMNPDGTCKKGILCGGNGGSDDLRAVCLDLTECPITQIVIDSGYSNSTGLWVDAGTIGSKNVYYTRDGGSAPMAELLPSMGRVCQNNNNKPFFISIDHPLIEKSSQIQTSCQGGTDDSFQKFVNRLLTI